MQPGVYRFLLATFLLWTCFTQAQAKETDVPALGQVKPSGKIANPALPVKTDTDSAAKAEEEIARRILELEKRQLAQLREIELRTDSVALQLDLRKDILANNQKLVDWVLAGLAFQATFAAITVSILLDQWQRARFEDHVRLAELVKQAAKEANHQAGIDLAYMKSLNQSVAVDDWTHPHLKLQEAELKRKAQEP